MRARRTDGNHDTIAKAFEALGCSVERTNDLWDLTIGYGGLTMLVEVKNPEQPPSKRKLTERELKFHQTWTGCVRVVEDLQDVKACVETLHRWKVAIMSIPIAPAPTEDSIG